MNSVSLVGNLARNPESGTTQSGVTYCRFTVACQRRFKNANGGYDADFISCIAWRQTAEFVQRYFIKGNKIGVNGSIQTRSYTAQDGTKRYTTDVVVDNVEFVAPKSGGGSPEADAGMRPVGQPDEQGFQEVEDEDLPF